MSRTGPPDISISALDQNLLPSFTTSALAPIKASIPTRQQPVQVKPQQLPIQTVTNYKNLLPVHSTTVDYQGQNPPTYVSRLPAHLNPNQNTSTNNPMTNPLTNPYKIYVQTKPVLDNSHDNKYVQQGQYKGTSTYSSLLPYTVGGSTLDTSYLMQIPQKNQENFYSNQQIIQKLEQTYGINSQSGLINRFIPLFQQLQIKYSPKNIPDCIQLANIVGLILKYPSGAQADLHRRANQLGTRDLKEGNINDSIYLPKCSCCGLTEQKQEISVFTDIDKVEKVGISTNLYFLTVSRLFFLLLLLFAIFSVFAIVTNLMASKMFRSTFNLKEPESGKLKTYQQILATSVGSKNYLNDDFAKTTSQIQCWLGLVYVLAWIAFFAYMKREERIKEYQIDYEEITIADYTLLFEKMPRRVQMADIQKQLIIYQNLIRQRHPNIYSDDPKVLHYDIEIEKINRTAPFYLDESIYDEPVLKLKNNQLNQSKKTFKNWLQKRRNSFDFDKPSDMRKSDYLRFEQVKKDRLKAYQKFGQWFLQKERNKNAGKQYLDIFLTFKRTENKELLQRLHDRQTSLVFNTPCFKSRDYFKFTCESGQIIEPKIRPAPEPEDVKWISLSRTTGEIICINAVSFLITALIFLLTFFSVFALTMVQVHYRIESEKNSKDLIASIIAGSISLIITVLNIVISLILNALTKMERNESYTHEQNSIGLKTVIVTVINMILLPMVISLSIKGNVYGVDGLAEDVFNLAISTAFVAPLVKFINPSYVINRIKYMWKSRVSSKLQLSQKQLNILNEKVDFEVGTSYAGVITLYLFTNFFASLQPLIVPISMAGLVLSYMVSKYVLFKQCKRPVPGNNLINARMHQMVALGPLFYAIGSILWVNLSSNRADMLPNILALILSIIAALFPFRQLSRRMVKNEDMKHRSGIYSSDKQNFISEYDRMNPLTAKDAKQKQMLQTRVKNQRKKEDEKQKIAGLSTSNNTDMLKLAQFFEGIDANVLNNAQNTSNFATKDDQRQVRQVINQNPIKIEHISNVDMLNIPQPLTNQPLTNPNTTPLYYFGQPFNNQLISNQSLSTQPGYQTTYVIQNGQSPQIYQRLI